MFNILTSQLCSWQLIIYGSLLRIIELTLSNGRIVKDTTGIFIDTTMLNNSLTYLYEWWRWNFPKLADLKTIPPLDGRFATTAAFHWRICAPIQNKLGSPAQNRKFRSHTICHHIYNIYSTGFFRIQWSDDDDIGSSTVIIRRPYDDPNCRLINIECTTDRERDKVSHTLRFIAHMSLECQQCVHHKHHPTCRHRSPPSFVENATQRHTHTHTQTDVLGFGGWVCGVVWGSYAMAPTQNHFARW